MRDLIGFGIFLGAMLVGMFVLIGIPVAAVQAWQCGKYEKATGKPTQYTGLECYVKDGSQWFAWEEYKHRLVTKGAM